MKKLICLLLTAAVALGGALYFTQEKSILPLDAGAVAHIEFQIYPQADPIFTLSDQRVLEVVEALNSLERLESNDLVDMTSDHRYQLLLAMPQGNVWVNLDEQALTLSEGGPREAYLCDTAALRAILEEICSERS